MIIKYLYNIFLFLQKKIRVYNICVKLSYFVYYLIFNEILPFDTVINIGKEICSHAFYEFINFSR